MGRGIGTTTASSVGSNGNLTAIVAPNTVTNIGVYAFYGSDYLTSASFPAVTHIGLGAFFHSDGLASISLPAIEEIKDAAFGTCYSLALIDFGATISSVPTFGSNAFSGVPTSCKIIVPDSLYDTWIASSGWSTLYANGYKFLRYSEWE